MVFTLFPWAIEKHNIQDLERLAAYLSNCKTLPSTLPPSDPKISNEELMKDYLSQHSKINFTIDVNMLEHVLLSGDSVVKSVFNYIGICHGINFYTRDVQGRKEGMKILISVLNQHLQQHKRMINHFDAELKNAFLSQYIDIVIVYFCDSHDSDTPEKTQSLLRGGSAYVMDFLDFLESWKVGINTTSFVKQFYFEFMKREIGSIQMYKDVFAQFLKVAFERGLYLK